MRMSSKPYIIVLLLAVTLGGCSTSDPEAAAQNDPFEPTNRAFFDFTQKADRYVAKPVAKGYIAVVPEPARDGIHNFLVNLNLPVTFGNNVLQGDAKGAGRTLGRFVVNTTVGVGGLIDVASKIGLPEDPQDLGITFGKWGLAEGPYLFLPLLGPAPPRDALGRVGDTFMDPLFYIKFHNSGTWMLVRTGVSFIDERSRTIDQLEAIERTSVDFYATTRSLYRQSRNAKINGNQPNLQSLPNF
jgi:phospholipid-binding lipoprotein MlaA